ncbi:hypothetical protein BDW02DRAFT_603673 [Decorospora gaudefroyi]|uniref:Uncharacterized protein n=1 Tax=Decorospora gaudefroyi TaxID=184978 RepID=A0A6A5K446_9PLEO|nr:hypothetical protein BDW02DRAFT_603673 [Decorospora gaudefroyi]
MATLPIADSTSESESPAPTSNNALRKRARRQRRGDDKRRRFGAQDQIRMKHGLARPSEATVRGKLAQVAARELNRIRSTNAIKHAAIPNPNYKKGADVPQYAAIRILNCVDEPGQERLLGLAQVH